MLLFRFEYKTSVIYHNVDTQNVKIVRRDRPHILVSHRCETFVHLLHIDTSPVTRTLICFLRQKRARELGQTTGTGNEKRRTLRKSNDRFTFITDLIGDCL